MDHWDWLLLAILFALAWLFPRAGETFFRRAESFFSRFAARRSAAIALVFFGTILLRLALLPVLPVPVPGIHDEFSYLLAADTFAHGRLANPPHPLWLSFETFHVNGFPAYASMFPPAQGFALALGQILGHPWIGVLLSNAAMAAAILWMLQGWLPSRWAFLGGVITVLKLGLISYWMNSYWGGAVAAAGGALVLGSLVRIFRRPRLLHALLLGLGIAILANSRPLEGLIFSLPSAVALLFWFFRSASASPKEKVRLVLAPLLVTGLLLAALLAYYNWRLTGDALLLPHVLNSRTYRSYSLFLWESPKPPLHYNNRQFEVFYNQWARGYYRPSWASARLVSGEKLENYTDALLWPGFLPLLLCLPAVFGSPRLRLLLWTLVLSGAGLFAVVWSLPHYAAPVLCVIYAVLLQCFRHLRRFRIAGRPAGLGLSRMIFILFLWTVSHDIYHRIRYPFDWGWNGSMSFWLRAGVENHLKQMSGKQLVIVRYGPLHNIHEEWVFNGADIDSSKVVWARELDPAQNRKLLAYFPDRNVWLIQPENWDKLLTPYAPPGPGLPPYAKP